MVPRPVLRVIAPSGPFDRESFARGIAWLETHYEVRFREDIVAESGYLAGSDERRLAELHEALRDEDAVAIVAARGGYGATRLLPVLSLEAIRRARVPLVGFSDVTALHALWAQAGIPSLHAPMVAWLGDAGEVAQDRWRAALAGEANPLEATHLAGPAGPIRAPVLGGNIAVLAALCGTPHLPRGAGHALLLEDVGEAPYRLDRALTTLLQSGFFGGAVALLLGELVRCEGRGLRGRDVALERLAPLGLPLYSVPVGHGERNEPVPLGIPARLGQGWLRFDEGEETS